MTTYYMDTAGSNTSPYDTWAKAAASLQTVADTATAGDIVYCRGTQTLAAPIDFDTNAGTTALGYIKFIGCDASGVANADQFTLDGNGSASHCTAWTSVAAYVWIENFTFTGATGSGLYRNGSQPQGVALIDCIIESNAGIGIGDYFYDALYYRCIIRNNSGDGVHASYLNNLYVFCWIYNNGGLGVDSHTNYWGQAFIGCVFASNASHQLELPMNCIAFNCVVDGEGDGTSGHGIDMIDGFARVFGCRITHNDGSGMYGLHASSKLATEDWNAYFDNDSDIDADVEQIGNSDTTLADDGYVNRATQDYNVATGKDIRSEAVNLNWDV